MKQLVKSLLFYALGFIAAAYLLPGFHFDLTQTLYLAAFIFAILNSFVKPILNTVLFPLHFLTMGFLKPLISLGLLYAVSIILPNFKITGFEFQGFSAYGLTLPASTVNFLFTIVIASFIITLVYSILDWFLN